MYWYIVITTSINVLGDDNFQNNFENNIRKTSFLKLIKKLFKLIKGKEKNLIFQINKKSQNF